ncbi:hypothetical protein AI29_14920 [bacteria symbiont BFo2 of Frankliniella occidentalis]|nr:hypothetical protein AI29_14920 [bacteria symbiont BFo2 of Frankliniella occidentalis]KYP90236.1 hypothetical protein WB60_08060 [bacteria symbiont BFo2 of Frankliniella occidentalis]KYP93998.1 hypothetical protein WB67_11780 [bacteria symbiont BFo2 of Frankliniella occidentalis]
MTTHSDAQASPSSAVTPIIIPNMVAIVGCDGSGKSTITTDLIKAMQKIRPTERRYLGLISGEDGDKIKKLPIIGVWLERRLAKKSEKTQSMRSEAPPLWAAFIMYALSCWRSSNFHKARALAESGVLVIADRYPQAEISGFHYDGPGLGVERVKGWLLKEMAKREVVIYEKLANYQPQLIIRLDIDVETAFARKPDHSYQELSDKIGVMRQLNYNGANIVDLDSRKPYEEVLASVVAAVKAIQ